MNLATGIIKLYKERGERVFSIPEIRKVITEWKIAVKEGKRCRRCEHLQEGVPACDEETRAKCEFKK